MMPSIDILQQYAPHVAPQTIAAIIRVESGGNQLAIGVNGRVKTHIHPKSAQEAATQARHFISRGYSVDLGLMQINSRNLPALGLTIEQAFDPGANIQAGARILMRGYRGAVKRYGPGQDALRAALSAYNTGNYEQGFKNGYVRRFFSGACRASRFTAAIAPTPINRCVLPSDKRILYIEPAINTYAADLTVYKQDEMPQQPSEDIRQTRLEDPAHNLADLQLPTVSQ